MIEKIRDAWNSRPPFAASLCSTATMLLGILILVWGAYKAFAEPDAHYYILSLFGLLTGSLALITAWGYWRRRTWGAYVHFLSIIILLIAKEFTYFPGAAFWLLTCVLIASFCLLVWMSCFLRIKPIWIALVLGIGLASASYYYQRTGPSIGIYGTECAEPPHGYCYGPLLGAGFPLQFVLDVPGVSIIGRLGYEDDFLLPFYFLDAAFFGMGVFAISWLGRRIVMIRRKKDTTVPARTNGQIRERKGRTR
jgi:hypothetical protein